MISNNDDKKIPDISLSQIVDSNHKYEFSVSNEIHEDANARRMKEAEDARLRRQMTFILFIFSLLITSILFVGCVYIFITGTADDKKWSAGIVSMIASGLVGYLVGQGKK